MLKTIKFPETKIGTSEHMKENPSAYETFTGGVWHEATSNWGVNELICPETKIIIKNKKWNFLLMNNKVFHIVINNGTLYHEIWRIKQNA